MNKNRLFTLCRATAQGMLFPALLLSALCFAVVLVCSFSLSSDALFIAGGACALILPLLLLKPFSHLFSKNESDFTLALPFTAKERYTACLLTGVLFCLFIWLIFASFALFESLFTVHGTSTLASALLTLLQQCATLLLGCALVSFGAVMGGKMLSALCWSVVFPAVLLLWAALSPTNRLLSYAYSTDDAKVFAVKSLPVVSGFLTEKEQVSALDLIEPAFFLLLALALSLLGGLLYCKRRGENAGHAQSEKWEDILFSLIIWLPCFAICLLLLINDEIHAILMLFPLPLIANGVFYLVCVLIRSRLKWRRILRLLSMTVIPLGLALLSALEFGLGALWLTAPIPAEDIVSVHTEQPLFSDIEGVEGLYEMNRYKDHFNFMNETRISCPEALARFEKIIIPFEFSKWGGQPVIVTLKDGRTVTRIVNFNDLFTCFDLEYGDPAPENEQET
ncbi:MAG: hypothetical protein IJX08_00405 [Clostridia bacterium]|nr:hypothetical protein [Clostridia bacterium]